MPRRRNERVPRRRGARPVSSLASGYRRDPPGDGETARGATVGRRAEKPVPSVGGHAVRVLGRGMPSFDVGDKVVYPHHGAAVIEKREKREAFGEKREYL